MEERTAIAPTSPTSQNRKRAVEQHRGLSLDDLEEVLDTRKRTQTLNQTPPNLKEAAPPGVLELIGSCYHRFDLDGSGTLNSGEDLTVTITITITIILSVAALVNVTVSVTVT